MRKPAQASPAALDASGNRLARWREMKVRVGTAGWSIAREAADQFPAEGSSLMRYAERFAAVEINSSFHRPHLEKTWARWRDEVPRDFRFSVKIPKEISHQRKLVACDEALADFARQVWHLGEKLGVLLLQLPPKLEFDLVRAEAFFERLSGLALANLACEPRHRSWFSEPASQLLSQYKVARVGADPDVTELGASPGAWRGLEYWRLHGSPHIYRSSYADRIPTISDAVKDKRPEFGSWCIFDNTASSAATCDALALMQTLGDAEPYHISRNGREGRV